jgi:HlyD family secretion protein
VYVIRDGRAALVRLEIGLANDERAEVVSGLEEGDLVVLAPEADLADGTRVAPVLPEGS